ncbi:hypothetical protein BDV18DRAFT_156257 [Aspergillus unguis]
MSSTSDIDDYLDDIDDLDDYLDDIDDYLPTTTASSSYPTSGSSYDDYSDDSDTRIAGIPGFPIGALSDQETSSSCVSEVAFQTTGPKVDLAFDVIFLVLFLALGGVAGFALLKSKRRGAAIGKWILFPVSLFFAILYLFIDMLTLILSQCVMMRQDKYQRALVAVKWFDSISIFILIAIILLPICLKLQKGGGTIATLTLPVHAAWLGLCGIFLLVSLAVYSKAIDSLLSDDFPEFGLVRSARDVTMAYYVFLFLAALLAGANMFFALFRKKNLQKGVLMIAVPALGLSTLVLTLVLMGGYADIYYGSMTRSLKYYEQAGDAQVFLIRLFYAVSFVSALVVAGSEEEGDDHDVPASAPPMGQPGN